MKARHGSRPGVAQDSGRRAWWLKTLHSWHWISSAICLLGMLLFSVTGITLNHAGLIESKPQVQRMQATLPEALRGLIQRQAKANEKSRPLPREVEDWAHAQWAIRISGREAEWSPEEAYVSLPRPGGDAWIRIDVDSGDAEYELTDRGWISYLNDLHKGRNTGLAWSLFIDVFAVAALLFSITGLLILKMHAAKRPLTWPLVGLGVVIPALLGMLLIH